MCCQHTAYISGRGLIQQELESVNAGLLKSSFVLCYFNCKKYYVFGYELTGSVATTSGVTESNESFVLTLTGKCLDVSGLVNKKEKFRFRGGKEAMKQLEESGLGKLIIN